MMAMRNSGIPVRAAVAIASGTTSAAVAMLPGPIDESPAAVRKNMIGMAPRLPRQRPTARRVTCSSVPLHCASVKSSVTPVSVRNSCEEGSRP